MMAGMLELYKTSCESLAGPKGKPNKTGDTLLKVSSLGLILQLISSLEMLDS